MVIKLKANPGDWQHPNGVEFPMRADFYHPCLSVRGRSDYEEECLKFRGMEKEPKKIDSCVKKNAFGRTPEREMFKD